jgi:acyl carrier protein
MGQQVELEASIRAMLARLFPDHDVAGLASDADLSDALDLDSMAVIDVALEIERLFGVRIPDEDLPGLTSIGAITNYVAAQAPAA